MTEAQLRTKKLLRKNKSYLTNQQIKTLNGLIKAGDVIGAMNGLHTILARRNWGTKRRNDCG